jgi:antitoxin FitA
LEARIGSLIVRNLNDETKRRLRRRAADAGRSLEEEVRQTLGQSVGVESGPALSGADLLKRIRARFEPLGGAELEIPPREPARDPPDFS